MSVIQLMVTIIIVTILVTVILGIVSYVAYWLRRVRRPAAGQEVDLDPRFFYRHFPEEPVAEVDPQEEVDTAASGDGSGPAPVVSEPRLVRG